MRAVMGGVRIMGIMGVMGGVDTDCAVNIIMNQCFVISN